MRYPTLLLLLGNDAGAAARLACAIELARRLESHLVGLSCRSPSPGTPAGLADEPAMGELRRAEDAALAREAVFRRRCEAGRVAFELAIREAAPLEALVEASIGADLLIVSQPDPLDGAFERRMQLVAQLLARSPRPTLVLPPYEQRAQAGSTALVAVDGSVQAARAVADALPLLLRASEVHLVSVARGQGAEFAGRQAVLERTATWLMRHGIGSRREVIADERDAGAVLRSHAERIGAGIVVMGAWGRPRVVERVLGGTTRDMLARMHRPVLFSR
jgi:nucleotide-binding universal stress UspA family protein